MSEIMATSEEQGTGIRQVHHVIGLMDQVTQQNAALVEEAAASTEAMQEQARNLAQAVSVFKLSTPPSGTAGVTVAARAPSFATASAAQTMRVRPIRIDEGTCRQHRRWRHIRLPL